MKRLDLQAQRLDFQKERLDFQEGRGRTCRKLRALPTETKVENGTS